MQIMVDTNVVLDVLLNRTAHVNESAAVLKAASDDIQVFATYSKLSMFLPYQKSTFGRLSIADGKILKMPFKIPSQNITGSTVSSRNTSDYSNSALSVMPPQEFVNKFVSK